MNFPFYFLAYLNFLIITNLPWWSKVYSLLFFFALETFSFFGTYGVFWGTYADIVDGFYGCLILIAADKDGLRTDGPAKSSPKIVATSFSMRFCSFSYFSPLRLSNRTTDWNTISGIFSSIINYHYNANQQNKFMWN